MINSFGVVCAVAMNAKQTVTMIVGHPNKSIERDVNEILKIKFELIEY